MAESCVDLHIRKVECCSAGCVAFTAHRKCFTACDIGKAPRHRADGDPHKHAIYWPLLPWLRMMLVDSEMRTDMVKAMTEAREAAATSPVQGLRDWFDGATFHKLLELGYFPSTTCVPLSISTDGFPAWKQRGFEGSPIIATVLMVHPSSRVQVVSQLIPGITPGPGQAADLKSFLHPVAEELKLLAAGVSGTTVAGFSKPQVLRALVVHFTGDMPACDKLLNAIGGTGEYPGRFRLFAGVRLKH